MSVDIERPKKPFLPKRTKKVEAAAVVTAPAGPQPAKAKGKVKASKSVPSHAGGFAVVDLLPQEVKAGRQSLVLVRLTGTAFLAVVAVVGGGYLLAAANAAGAQSELATAQSATVVLQSKQSQFLEGRATATSIEALRGALVYAGSTDVDLRSEIDPILARLPEGAVVKSVNATFPAAWEPALTPADDLRQERVGNITFTIESPTAEGVTTWARTLTAENGYADSTVDSSELKDGYYESVVTFNIGADVRSNRFAAETGE